MTYKMREHRADRLSGKRLNAAIAVFILTER